MEGSHSRHAARDPGPGRKKGRGTKSTTVESEWKEKGDAYLEEQGKSLLKDRM